MTLSASKPFLCVPLPATAVGPSQSRTKSVSIGIHIQSYIATIDCYSNNPIGSMYGIFTYMTGSFMGQMLVNIPAPWILWDSWRGSTVINSPSCKVYGRL